MKWATKHEVTARMSRALGFVTGLSVRKGPSVTFRASVCNLLS